MNVKTHPLAEIMQKKLLGLWAVPIEEQKKMINRAIKAAVEFYEEQRIAPLMGDNNYE